MSKVTHIHHKQRIMDAAGLWLARLERGLTEAEKREIADWLTEDQTHHEALLELAHLWDEMAVLEELSDLFPLPKPAAQNTGRAFRHHWAKPTFALASLLTLAWLGWQWQHDPTTSVAPSTPLAQLEEKSAIENANAGLLETAVGEQRTHQLPDGSTVTLNTDTELKVEFSATERKILLLRGEGFFQVKKEAARPFIVLAGKNKVQAVGTAFNLDYSNRAHLEVTVTEGKVKLLAPKKLTQALLSGSLEQERYLSGGQSVTLEAEQIPPPQSITAKEIDTMLAWQRGMVIFEREPLKQALAELSRYTAERFVLSDPKMESLLVGGYFKSGDIDGLLLALEENFAISSERTPDGTILLRRL